MKPEESSEIVFFNGKIVTLDPPNSIASAVSVKDGLIAVIGSDAGFEEEVKGSIEPGKLADLIVIDRDILTIPENNKRYQCRDDSPRRKDRLSKRIIRP